MSSEPGELQYIVGDKDFRTLSREALVGVTYGPAQLSAPASHLRAAYNCAVSGRAGDAAKQSQAAVEAARASGDVRLAGWVGETHAAYLQSVDAVAAQAALAQAVRDNGAVLRPLAGLDYQKIAATSAQSEQASRFLMGRYVSGAELVVGIEALLADIEWDHERTDQAEAAIQELGLHLGFTSQQPELVYGIGSDVLWALGQHTYAVIEAKTGATAPLIWKKDINQLGGSVNWCLSEYGADATVIPVIVHPSHTIERSGTPPPGTRVMTTSRLRALKSAVRSFAKTLAAEDQYRLAGVVEAQLSHHQLTAASLFDKFTVDGRREPKKP